MDVDELRKFIEKSFNDAEETKASFMEGSPDYEYFDGKCNACLSILAKLDELEQLVRLPG